MKKIVIFVVMLIFFAGATFEGFSQDKKNDKKENVSNQKPGKPVNTICPVTDEEADAEIVTVYKGVTYALCCKRCLKKFEKDPEKYIKKINLNKSN